MSMFCYQCQEAAKGTGCVVKGVCGKDESVAKMLDLLLYVNKGIALCNEKVEVVNKEIDNFIVDSLFTTVTNVNFDKFAIVEKIKKGLIYRDSIKSLCTNSDCLCHIHDAGIWTADSFEEFEAKADTIGVLSTENEDVRSLRELLIYGVKGMAAYLHHAINLGYSETEIVKFMKKALVASLNDNLSADELVALVMECGKYSVDTMALLDKANTSTYGNPEITEVNIGVRNNPAILISGHDLKDMEELLKQTEGSGVDVYTHSEMLPANYYPSFKKYEHFAGNYGNAWHKQGSEFESFNGPILMTTNCMIPPKDSYKDRIYTTGSVGFENVIHIEEGIDGASKDFSVIIEQAKKCESPTEIETGTIVGGFAHNQVMQLADKIIDAVKSGAIKKFVVMAGCDGRHKSRDYYTEFAEKLPKDTIILTAGCAKYRYNKLNLGDIGGIPRVLDAGQCNDSYSLAVIALKLKEVFELNDINDLPIVYNIAWYEQKALTVLLALLFLGVKNIHIGPTLPAFLSPNVAKVLIETFKLGVIGNVEDDIQLLIN
ncbi:hydroxylamine reductase [Bacteroidota bacterium]